jgi:hypothetical protein
MSTPARQDQFEISAKGIIHTPTGAAFTPYPGEPNSGHMTYGQLGNVLPNGEDYRPYEVEKMMRQLWTEYVENNPGLFKTSD